MMETHFLKDRLFFVWVTSVSGSLTFQNNLLIVNEHHGAPAIQGRYLLQMIIMTREVYRHV